MRHSATRSLLERRDVVVVASVSCIYGIGAPETYQGMHVALREGERHRPRRDHPAARSPCSTSATTTTSTGARSGCGATWSRCSRPTRSRRRSGSSCSATRSTRIHRHRPAQGAGARPAGPEIHIYPASHYVTPAAQLERALETVQDELGERLAFLRGARTGCWRPSGWSSARSSTWRCCASSATATASRTTRATSPAAGRARPRRC